MLKRYEPDGQGYAGFCELNPEGDYYLVTEVDAKLVGQDARIAALERALCDEGHRSIFTKTTLCNVDGNGYARECPCCLALANGARDA